jgi:nucleotide-binding universal stress UspA family protein
VIPPALATTVADTPRVESERWWADLYVRVEDEHCRLLKQSRIPHRIVIVPGCPATEILRVADQEEAGLVVVGNGLHSTMTELFLGSVAHELSHHARRPLVIVPIPVAVRAVDALGRKQRPEEGGAPAPGDHAMAGASPAAARR